MLRGTLAPEDNINASNDGSRKRKRLTHACNRCRSKKTRCDERQPDCTNCVSAGAICVTQDPRHPSVAVKRHEAQQHARHSTYQESSRLPTSQIAARTSPTASVISGEAIAVGGLRTAQVAHINLQSQHDKDAQFDEDSRAILRGEEDNLPAIPRFVANCSVQILTQWLDLAFARIGLPQRLSGLYQESQSVQWHRSLQTPQSSLVEILSQFHQKNDIMIRFVSTVNLVFPLLGTRDQELAHDENHHQVIAAAGNIPTLNVLIRCLLLAAASANNGQSSQDLSSQCLNYVVANLGTLIMSDTMEAVTVLLLSAIILRCHNKGGMARNMLGLGVSMALALGMNRPLPRGRSPNNFNILEQQYYRVWWSLFILDRTLSIELERPVLIRDFDCLHNASTAIFHESSSKIPFYRDQERIFTATCDLARLQGQVSERLFISRHAQEKGTMSLEEVIVEKMSALGELDQLLVAWSEQLPQDLRPSEYSICDPHVLPAVSFLATQFYQTLFLISRNALIVSGNVIQASINTHFKDSPYRVRLSNGQKICCTAARSMINILNHVHDSDDLSALVSIHAPLVAICTLAIQTLRAPHAATARADLELQANAIRIISENKSQAYALNSTGLELLLQTLYQAVSSRVHAAIESTVADSAPGMQLSLFPEAGMAQPSEVRESYYTNPHLWNFANGGLNNSSVIGGLEEGIFEGNFDATSMDWDLLALDLDLPSR